MINSSGILWLFVSSFLIRAATKGVATWFMCESAGFDYLGGVAEAYEARIWYDDCRRNPAWPEKCHAFVQDRTESGPLRGHAEWPAEKPFGFGRSLAASKLPSQASYRLPSRRRMAPAKVGAIEQHNRSSLHRKPEQQSATSGVGERKRESERGA